MAPLSHTDSDKSEKIWRIYLKISEVRKILKKENKISEKPCSSTRKLSMESVMSRN